VRRKSAKFRGWNCQIVTASRFCALIHLRAMSTVTPRSGFSSIHISTLRRGVSHWFWYRIPLRSYS
jgi:hypothetical protein